MPPIVCSRKSWGRRTVKQQRADVVVDDDGRNSSLCIIHMVTILSTEIDIGVHAETCTAYDENA